MAHDLEAPGNDIAPEWATLYRARGSDVVEQRPVFTGDVFVNVVVLGDDLPKDVMVLQHPCAIRVDGVALVPRLLVAEVNPLSIVKPSLWPVGYYKQLPLAELRPDHSTQDYAASFAKPHLVTSEALAAESRIACLSQRGVNLLLQRWVHHNSRVVVPTQRYQDVSAAQFEEADMVEDWCIDRADDGVGTAEATREIDDWLSWRDDAGVSRRDRLMDDQSRSSLRRELRGHLRTTRG